MKIWGEVPKVPGIYDKQKKLNKIDNASGVSSKKDFISISNRAKDFQTAVKALRRVPDVRQDKINEIMEKYESGNYDVNGNDIADKILKSVLDKKV